jgi:hypothetical protein
MQEYHDIKTNDPRLPRELIREQLRKIASGGIANDERAAKRVARGGELPENAEDFNIVHFYAQELKDLSGVSGTYEDFVSRFAVFRAHVPGIDDQEVARLASQAVKKKYTFFAPTGQWLAQNPSDPRYYGEGIEEDITNTILMAEIDSSTVSGWSVARLEGAETEDRLRALSAAEGIPIKDQPKFSKRIPDYVLKPLPNFGSNTEQTYMVMDRGKGTPIMHTVRGRRGQTLFSLPEGVESGEISAALPTVIGGRPDTKQAMIIHPRHKDTTAYRKVEAARLREESAQLFNQVTIFSNEGFAQAVIERDYLKQQKLLGTRKATFKNTFQETPIGRGIHGLLRIINSNLVPEEPVALSKDALERFVDPLKKYATIGESIEADPSTLEIWQQLLPPGQVIDLSRSTEEMFFKAHSLRREAEEFEKEGRIKKRALRLVGGNLKTPESILKRARQQLGDS